MERLEKGILDKGEAWKPQHVDNWGFVTIFYRNLVGKMDEDCYEDTDDSGYELQPDKDPFQQLPKYLEADEDERAEMLAERVKRDTASGILEKGFGLGGQEAQRKGPEADPRGVAEGPQ